MSRLAGDKKTPLTWADTARQVDNNTPNYLNTREKEDKVMAWLC
jgi:hypothetical protein